ncbi:methyl-accepting chemotaxis protein [Pseudomonas berkeleyensis]|uniref:Methyl-accepting chemotaxis protein n=1 Tax=Pseudomonas berkeleyensis TaxID=2726956 RepID=A0A7G5DPM4_9PSED|nr:methyl-accepting chemotaxis protein [Pseudomonas berkeleyensis]QMV63699.1 methyl-accepting chemotaxis protein [Pseudomonas berkeleyensis]WSO39167.1 methyl-accepting chemotaxis protein [Pseudomonas berkeleyensis]
MLLRKMKIGWRAAASFAVLALLVLLLGWITMAQMSRMDNMSDAIEAKWFPSVLALDEMNLSAARIRALTLRIHITQDAQSRSTDLATLDQAKKDLVRVEQTYVQFIESAEEQMAYDAFRGSLDRYMASQSQVMEAILAGNDAQVRQLVGGVLSETADALTASMRVLMQLNKTGAANASTQSEEAYDSARYIVQAAIIVAILLTVALAFLFTRSVVVPLSKALGLAEDIAAGDLSRDVTDDGQDEPAQLLAALATMRRSLRDTIQQIADSSSQLASASEELHAVTEDSTRGLHQQNNEIEQAATAVNQMTAAVEEVARNAVSTSEASRETDHTARQGQSQVGQTVESIGLLTQDISTTSEEIRRLADNVRNIGQVVTVIRAIAEQTNLLALNAAIEAARAGEQGRGFAVVADEVRALAHRTQQSTGEVEQMIDLIQKETEQAVQAMDTSMQRAGSTLGLAQSAGQALEEITRSIGSINERNLVIASASEQQAQVAREVDRNLVNIRDLSLQSSAGADQTTAASQELSILAVGLNQLVTRFRL